VTNGEPYTIPATIDEPTLLDDVSHALRTIGYGKVPVSSGCSLLTLKGSRFSL